MNRTALRTVFLLCLAFAFVVPPTRAARALPPVQAAQAGPAPRVLPPAFHGVSRPFEAQRLPDGSPPSGEIPNPPLRKQPEGLAPSAPALPDQDSAVQQLPGFNAIPEPLLSFEGLGNADNAAVTKNVYWPPDPVGDIGYDPITENKYYVQWVNVVFAVWDVTETPTRLRGATPGNALWSGLSDDSLCHQYNNGDPIVLFDQLANRWVLSQFAFKTQDGPFAQCIAVSQTADPTGAYNAYEYLWPDKKMNDYQKMSVWTDGYYLSVNQFLPNLPNVTDRWNGGAVGVADREAMLAGDPDARLIIIDLFNENPLFGGILPADLDGRELPPPGAGGLFAEVDDGLDLPPYDGLRLWELDVDWDNPAAATFGQAGQPDQVLAVEPFNRLPCVISGLASRACIPQPATSLRLDAVADRLMYRLAYRNFGDYQSLTVNHTVLADGQDRAGVRWYELRSPGAGQPWAVAQQGTFAPSDGRYRWMASAAQDRVGNLAIGYSITGSQLYPSIAIAGRLAGDPANELTQGERIVVEGSGAQTESRGRWGDYTAMNIDPLDDCTFWYTNQYVQSDSPINWRTRIVAFRFPTCVDSPSGALVGVVRDAQTGQPVAGAKLRLQDNLHTRTDAAGRYAFRGVSAGVYDLQITATGYTSLTIAGVEVQDQAETTQDAALAPLVAVRLTGTVRDGTPGGHTWPLPARVTAVDSFGSQVSTVTDPFTGQYELSLYPDVSYTLTVAALTPGYLPESRSNFTLAGPPAPRVDFGLMVDPACSALGYDPDAVFSADFEDGPRGFTTQGDNSTWAYGTPTSGPGVAHSGSQGWATNLAGSYANQENSYLLTPVLNLTNTRPTLTARWWQWLQTQPGKDTAQLEIGANGAPPWQTGYGPVSGGAGQWELASADLSTILPENRNAVQLGFHLQADGTVNAPGWYIDDFAILQGCNAISGGLVSGVVRDQNTRQPVTGAVVEAIDRSGAAAASQELAGWPGFYRLFVPGPGLARVRAAAPERGYAAVEQPVTVLEDGLTRLDLNLPAGRLEVTPAAVDLRLAIGQQAELTFTVRNTGSAALDVHVSELDGLAPLLPAESGQAGAALSRNTPLPWAAMPPLPVPVAGGAGAFVDGAFYVAGGELSNGARSAALQRYDPTSHTWQSSDLPALPYPVSRACAVGQGSDLLVFGGITNGQPGSQVQVYHSSSQTWEVLLSDRIPANLAGAACVQLNEVVYLIGGITALQPGDSAVYSSAVYRFDLRQPAGARWRGSVGLAALPVAAAFGQAVSIDGRIYLAGLVGTGNVELARVLTYSPADNRWQSLPALTRPRGGAAVWAQGQRLFVGGGSWANPRADVEEYDTAQGLAGAWTQTSAMNAARTLFAAAADPQGALYAAGGCPGPGRALPGRCAAEPLPSAERVRLEEDIAWLSFNPTSLRLEPGQQAEVRVRVDSAGLAEGDLGGYLVFSTLMPYPPVAVPVRLTLSQAAFYLPIVPIG